VGPDAAVNHYQHAQAAEDALEDEVFQDLAALGQSEDDFQFFLAFAHEVMDRYGRFLCFINRNQPDADHPEPRPRSYNERLLEAGRVSPYFIWPNINPFRAQGSLTAAVLQPGTGHTVAEGDAALKAARQWVRDARQQQRGLFDAQNPLQLQPFEVRFLARRRPPNRWVIDLSKNEDLLFQPQDYCTVPHIEDRLFIPEEYVPLFVEAGWQRQT
jgi:hypothetical protein